MRNLVVTLADLEGVPHGSATARTSVIVSARYTWDLVTTDGAVIPAAMKPKPLPSGGAVTFSVHPSQDEGVAESWRGFGVVVEATIRRTDGRGADVRVSRTVVVPPGSGSVQLGALAPAEPLPPDLATVGDVIGAIDNLQAEATTLPPGSPAAATVTGPMGAKVINLSIPRGADGEPGMGYEEGQQLLDQNADTLAAAQTAATDAADAIRDNLVTDISTPGNPAYEALVDVAGDITDPATAGLITDTSSATRGALDGLLADVEVDLTDYPTKGEVASGYLATEDVDPQVASQVSTPSSQTVAAFHARDTVLEARDFGVAGDGVTDDTDAIRDLFRAAAGWTPNSKTGQKATIHFPAGEFIVSADNVFADLTTANNIGLNVVGAGMSATRFKLVTGGEPMWFYNNGETRRWSYVTISDCAFTTDGPRAADGATLADQHGGFAKIHSSGHEQFFKFFRCFFQGPWDTFIQTEGTGNADQIGLFACKVSDVFGHLMYINNPQSVIHEWYNVTATRLYGHGFTVGPQGGGDVKLVGGSWILMGINADTAPRYLFNLTDAAGTSHGNGTFAAWGIKVETHKSHMLLVRTPDTGSVRVSFRDCNLWTSFVSDPYVPVHVGRRGHVIFDGCTLPDLFGAHLDGPTLAQTGQDGDTLLQVLNSSVPFSLSDRITIAANKYARAIASGCIVRSNADRRAAVDFDIGWQVHTLGGPAPVPKRAIMRPKGRGWPIPTGTSEWGVELPAGAVISRVVARRPGQGSASTSYQLHIGAYDKSVIYASSTLGTPADDHNIDAEPWVDTADNPDARLLRIWATGTATTANAAGMPAWVEYL